MLHKNIKFLLILLSLGLLLQSCSEDEAVADTQSEIIDLRDGDQQNGPRGDGPGGNGPGGGGNGDGPGGNGPGGNNGNGENLPVDALDNDILEDWTDLMLDLERYSSGRPNGSARALAYIYLAAYESVVPGMEAYSSNANRLSQFEIDNLQSPQNIDWELALNAAFADVVDHFLLNLPQNLRDRINRMERDNRRTLERGLSQNTINSSRIWGEYVASQVIAYSQTDEEGETQVVEPQPRSYEPPVGEGYWTYSADEERALYPYWESVRTFVISPDETTTVPPLAYSENKGSPYYDQMMEVYTVNNAARAEQGEQLHIAEFWSDDVEGLMMSPPARQVSIANQLLDEYDLNLEQAIVLFVKLGFSLNDAAVSTWKYKYEYMVMRPSVFLHEFVDPEYQTNLYRLVYWPNPSFPGYPSGHSCFASAAAGVFIDMFGDETNFTDRTHAGRDEFLGAPRRFNSFRQMADENGYSRIPLGVHVRMDCTEGLRLGYEISDAVNDLDLSEKLP